ncbi:MAG: endopeptidase La [Actinobacteria bacterium]|nr:endopeptidase La [Actinomycetota bacterium]MBM3712016.1 endopeptidase La [Actinomycetota bacterium]
MAEKNKIEEPEEKVKIPQELPLLALKNSVVFPFLSTPLVVGRQKSIEAINSASREHKIILVVAQKVEGKEIIEKDDLYDVGTACVIKQVVNINADELKCVVEGVYRVKIKYFIQSEPYFRVFTEIIEDDPYVPDEETENLNTTIRMQVEKFIQLGIPLPTAFVVAATNISKPEVQADLFASYLLSETSQKQEILEERNITKRLKKLTEFLADELHKFEVQSQIRDKVQKEVGKTQREYYLRQQLKAIKEELGEADESFELINELGKKVALKNLPKDAKEKVAKEIKRLESMNSMSPEYSYIRTYIDWMLEVPWSEKTKDVLDLKKAKGILDGDHYDLEKVKEHILDYLAVRKLKGKNTKGPILCFVGPPGVGKTSLGQSIAKAMGRKFIRMSIGGIRDEAEIRGHRRTYVGALPGRIIQGLSQVKTNNPVFMLDEVDKVGADFRGDPSSALLEVLDPEQNNSFRDHYLEVPYDLSNVMFITTANILDTIHPALRDRMEIIEIPGYSSEEKIHIAEKFLIPKQMKEQGVDKYDIKFTRDSILLLIEEYTREAGVRNLEREIGNICKKIAREILSEKKYAKLITRNKVREYLGVSKIQPSEIEDKNRVGVSTGLAYTTVGGDIILIESTHYRGNGKLTLTGSLGEVMQESAKAAISYLHSRANDFGISDNMFNKYDIHVHVPAGAIPKDGPSAGVAITTSLLSALTGIPVLREVGMTGEITLRGRVLPIGGLKEKLLAAKRAGLKTVILPSKNKKDLEDIPQNIIRGLNLLFAENIDDVVKHALQSNPFLSAKSKGEVKEGQKITAVTA